jgi:uncharacterized membrane protein YbhN (UPF0104 family)
MKWIIRAAVSIGVAAVLLALIPLGAVVDATSRISVWAWSACLVVFAAGHYLNAVKLRLFIGPDAVSLSACVRAQYAGLAANLGLPGLAGGDFVRGAYLAPSAGLARVAAASVLDRVLDTLTLVVLIAVALPIAGAPPAIAAIVDDMWIVPGVVVASIAAIVLAVRLPIVRRVAAKLAPAWTSLATRPAALASAVLISFVVQPAFVLTNVWLARQVGVGTGLAAWFVAWPLSKLVAVLPISLGGLGVREAVLVSLLTPYGAPGDAVLASGFLWQGVLAVSGIGGLLLTQMAKRRAGASEAEAVRSAAKL